MGNPYRGEVDLVVNGAPCVMRLSLGALAGLEQRLGAGGLVPMIERFEAGRFTSQDLIALLHAGLQGGGWDGSEADLAAAEIEGGAVVAAQAAGRLLQVSFALPEGAEDDGSAAH